MFPVSILYFLACPGVPGNVPSMFPYFDFELSWYVPGMFPVSITYVPGMFPVWPGMMFPVCSRYRFQPGDVLGIDIVQTFLRS